MILIDVSPEYKSSLTYINRKMMKELSALETSVRKCTRAQRPDKIKQLDEYKATYEQTAYDRWCQEVTDDLRLLYLTLEAFGIKAKIVPIIDHKLWRPKLKEGELANREAKSTHGRGAHQPHLDTPF